MKLEIPGFQEGDPDFLKTVTREIFGKEATRLRDIQYTIAQQAGYPHKMIYRGYFIENVAGNVQPLPVNLEEVCPDLAEPWVARMVTLVGDIKRTFQILRMLPIWYGPSAVSSLNSVNQLMHFAAPSKAIKDNLQFVIDRSNYYKGLDLLYMEQT